MNDKKNILICPLEWGLGHAGRMVPLAKRLQELNNNIYFGSGEEHLSFLRNEVPGATYINFPDQNQILPLSPTVFNYYV